ncbi:MAG: amidohydrolase family protein [Nitrospinota bacterium]
MKDHLLLRRARVKGHEDLVDLRVEQGRIAEIAPTNGGAEARPAEVIDVEGRLVVPGFVDAHLHLDKGLVSDRVLNRSGTLAEALQVMRKTKEGFTFEDIRDRARRQIEMAVSNGSTALRSHFDLDSAVGLLGAEALRALRDELKDLVTLQLVALPHEDPTASPEFLKLLKGAIELSDLIGGAPRPGDEKFVDLLFDLAREYDRDLDLHVDEKDEPEPLAIRYVARKTMKEGYEGRVTAGHLCALSSLEPGVSRDVVSQIRDAGLNVITLPSTNLHIQGRGDDRSPRRGVTRVKEMLDEGIPVAYASDNLRDGFTPFGNADMLEVGLILAHAAHMGTSEGLRAILDMGTETAGRIFYRNDNYGVHVGNDADLVVLDTESFEKAIVTQPDRVRVFKKGRLVARSSTVKELLL